MQQSNAVSHAYLLSCTGAALRALSMRLGEVQCKGARTCFALCLDKAALLVLGDLFYLLTAVLGLRGKAHSTQGNKERSKRVIQPVRTAPATALLRVACKRTTGWSSLSSAPVTMS